MKKQKSRMLTVSVVAERLGCHPASVYRMLEDGRLPFIRTGRRKGFRIRSIDVDEFERREIENCWSYEKL